MNCFLYGVRGWEWIGNWGGDMWKEKDGSIQNAATAGYQASFVEKPAIQPGKAYMAVDRAAVPWKLLALECVRVEHAHPMHDNERFYRWRFWPLDECHPSSTVPMPPREPIQLHWSEVVPWVKTCKWYRPTVFRTAGNVWKSDAPWSKSKDEWNRFEVVGWEEKELPE